MNTARALRPARTASADSVCDTARSSGGIDEATVARSASAWRTSYSLISPASKRCFCRFTLSTRVPSVSCDRRNSASRLSSWKYAFATCAASTVRTVSAL